MPSQLQVSLLPANFELDGMTLHGLAAKYSFKMAAPKVFGDKFIQDSRHFIVNKRLFLSAQKLTLGTLNRI